jgi:hypothetical protein
MAAIEPHEGWILSSNRQYPHEKQRFSGAASGRGSACGQSQMASLADDAGNWQWPDVDADYQPSFAGVCVEHGNNTSIAIGPRHAHL